MALQVTSCTLRNNPEKLLDKGAAYFRERTNRGILRKCGRRKSAVELLEASKSQYVKSSHVLEQRQGLGPAGDHGPISAREKFPRCTKENDGEVQSLPRAYRRDRKLRYSIGACENIPHSLQPPVRVRPTGRATGTDKTEVYPDISNSISAPGDVSKSSDVNDEHLSMEGVQKSTGQVPCVSVSPKYRPLISTAVSGKEVCVHSSIDLSEERLLRRQKAIHRSQSDLSSRHSRSSADFSDLSSRVSRTSVELERFFNEMGLDKTVIDPMLRKQSQSFSEFDLVEGMSSLGSPDARSNCSGVSKSEKTDHTGPEGGEKPISSTSVVERNARIIKWLCNVKKARNMAASTEKAETS